MRVLRGRFRRWRYDRYIAAQHRKLAVIAASPSWRCDRCGLVQSSDGRQVRQYWQDSNYSDVWPRADFVAMSCWDCGAPIVKTVKG